MTLSSALCYLLENEHASYWRQDESGKFYIAGCGGSWSGLTAQRLIDHAEYCQRQDAFVEYGRLAASV